EQGRVRAPIVAITANALKGEAEHCRAVGMDDYVSKPVQLTHLNAVLQKWLPSTSHEGQPASAAPLPSVPPVPPVAAPDTIPMTAPAAPVIRSAGEKPVEVRVLEELVGNDPEVIGEFLRDFRASSGRIAAEIRSACQAGQAQIAGAAAHKLKSSARSVGALALGELCAEMERTGKAGDMQALNALLPRFEAELGAVDAYIDSRQA
ncbi:MAG: Hpt domain-containing protein, partial [Betaproteobacteria bacterium]|nr:Hpt domain-containing protein [Betaproteobacteria bacterium]